MFNLLYICIDYELRLKISNLMCIYLKNDIIINSSVKIDRLFKYN